MVRIIHGTGIDIVNIEEIEVIIRKWDRSFVDKVFSEREIEYCDVKVNRFQHYAVKFSAKEAFMKALDAGICHGIAWNEIEILNDPLGKPYVELRGNALEISKQKNIKQVFISVSHDNGLGVAMVVLEKNNSLP